MGLLTREEQMESWRRLHSGHPYGTTSQMCHVHKAMRGHADAYRSLGNGVAAGALDVLSRLVERRVIITTSVVNRVFLRSRGEGL